MGRTEPYPEVFKAKLVQRAGQRTVLRVGDSLGPTLRCEATLE